MVVTQFVSDALSYRRFVRQRRQEGWIRIEENGDPLWKFHRGGWHDRRIDDVKIAPGGHELWIKVSDA